VTTLAAPSIYDLEHNEEHGPKHDKARKRVSDHEKAEETPGPLLLE
jgi:hypothetical protein